MRLLIAAGLLLGIISSSIGQHIESQADLKAYFSRPDTLNIDIVKGQDEHLAFVQYTLKPKNTLYSISKYFNVSIKDILKYNPQLTQKMPQLGDILQIPIHIESLGQKPSEDLEKLPVFYQVKKGETLYTISKNYFGTSVEDISIRAGLKSIDLQPDQRLFLGYFHPHLDLSPDSAQDTTSYHTSQIDQFEQVYTSHSIIAAKGIAFWRKAKKGGKVFALHRDARVGSYIEITNPMFGITIYAKVVGRLPSEAYTEDIMVVLSPQAADQLGALDSRFFVKVRYIK